MKHDEDPIRIELKGYSSRLIEGEPEDLENISPLRDEKKHMRTVLAIAVTLVLIVAAAWFFMKPHEVEGDLFASNFEPYPIQLVEQAEGDNANMPEPVEAIRAYEEGRYADAASMLSASRMSGLYQMYSGIAFLASDQPRRSLDMLLPLTNHSEVAEQAQWYVALAYLKLDDQEHTLLWLNRIVENDGHAYARKAQRLLKDLATGQPD